MSNVAPFAAGPGGINFYYCINNECERQYTVTLDMATGVTPFIIPCISCGAMSRSSVYRAPLIQGSLKVDCIYYRPTPPVFRQLPLATQQHVLKGWLILGTFPDDCIKHADLNFEGLTQSVDQYLELFYAKG